MAIVNPSKQTGLTMSDTPETTTEDVNDGILKAVLRNLNTSRGNWVEISQASGVPYHTLTKIAQGAVQNPRIETVQRLVDYFSRNSNKDAPAIKAEA